MKKIPVKPLPNPNPETLTKLELEPGKKEPDPADIVHENMMAESMHQDMQEKQGLGFSFKKVADDWDSFDGPVKRFVNSLDPDFETSRMGQSIEILMKSIGILNNQPYIYFIMSTVHYSWLKVKKIGVKDILGGVLGPGDGNTV